MKYITNNYEELFMSYQHVKTTLAYKDIMKFLGEEKLKAMQKLKKQDDAAARGTWQLVDRLIERMKNLNREVEIKKKEE